MSEIHLQELLAVGAGSYGCVVGAVVYAFVQAAHRLDVKGLGGLGALMGGGALLLAFERVRATIPNADLFALAGYGIGLLLGWGLPALLDWHKAHLEGRAGPP
jgi:hypothetical protein